MNAQLLTLGEDSWSKAESVPKKDGTMVSWHDVGACITPKQTEEETLNDAWDLVRELARWVDSQNPRVSDNFRIIVGWSKKVRAQQGQIFKIWESNDELPFICASETYREYSQNRGKGHILLKGWQKDVFSKQEQG